MKTCQKVLAGNGASKGESWRTSSMHPPASNHWENRLALPSLPPSPASLSIWACYSTLVTNELHFSYNWTTCLVQHRIVCCLSVYIALTVLLHQQSISAPAVCSHGCAPFYAQMLWIAWFPTFCEALGINPRWRGSQRKWVSRLCVGSSWERSEQAQWGVVGDCY